jgi:hypothetical protein
MHALVYIIIQYWVKRLYLSSQYKIPIHVLFPLDRSAYKFFYSLRMHGDNQTHIGSDICSLYLYVALYASDLTTSTAASIGTIVSGPCCQRSQHCRWHHSKCVLATELLSRRMAWVLSHHSQCGTSLCWYMTRTAVIASAHKYVIAM